MHLIENDRWTVDRHSTGRLISVCCSADPIVQVYFWWVYRVKIWASVGDWSHSLFVFNYFQRRAWALIRILTNVKQCSHYSVAFPCRLFIIWWPLIRTQMLSIEANEKYGRNANKQTNKQINKQIFHLASWIQFAVLCNYLLYVRPQVGASGTHLSGWRFEHGFYHCVCTVQANSRAHRSHL